MMKKSGVTSKSLAEGSIGTVALRLTVSVTTVFLITFACSRMGLGRPFYAGTGFLFVVFIVSIAWGFRYSTFTAVIAAVGFSWVLPPENSFRIRDPRDVFALIAFLLIGTIGSYLSNRIRQEASNAERRRAEAIAAQEQYRDLVNSVEGIVWEADAETFALWFVSDQAERILGYPVEQWLRERDFWKEHIHPEDRQHAIQYRQDAIAERRSYDFEYRMIAADGRLLWMRDLATVVVEHEGVSRLRGVMVDVTARKKD
jgi:PAS domain S-box-containing protein